MAMRNPFLDLPGDTTPQEKPINPWIAGAIGLNTGVERFTHGLLQPLYESGLLGENFKRGSQKVAKEREADYQKASQDHPLTAGLLSTVGGIGAGIPLMAIPGMGQSALARAVTSGAMQGGLYGGGQYVEGNDLGQRLQNTGIGAGLGGAIPVGMAAAGKLASPITNYLFPKSKILSQTAGAVDNADEMFANKDAATRLGFNASPAEASGNELLAQMQGRAGTSEAGAKALQTYGREHLAQQKGAIGGLINNISPNVGSAATDVRIAAQDVLRKETRTLQKQAKPLYEKAYQDEISQTALDNLLKNKRFKMTYGEVLSDPDFSQQLRGQAPKGKTMLAMVQNRIGNLLSDAEKKPYNQSRIEQLSYARGKVGKYFGDPIVQDVLKEIKTSDPVFNATLMGVNPRSIQMLDLVKRKMGDTYSSLSSIGQGLSPYKASLVQGTMKKTTKTGDWFSPYYKEARATFGEGAKPLQALKESQLGRIADLSDTQVKNVSKMIFDPAQTDIKVMGQLRDKIGKQSAGAWNQIVRNEMERRLDKTAGTGANFYGKFLKGDRDFNQMLEATKNIPGANQKLIDMKSAFKNIINPVTPQTTARLAKSSLDVPRSTMQSVKDMLGNALGGRYDKAFVEFVTNPKWDIELKNYMKLGAKTPAERALKYGNILMKIGGASGIQEATQPLTPRQEEAPAPSRKTNERNPFLDL